MTLLLRSTTVLCVIVLCACARQVRPPAAPVAQACASAAESRMQLNVAAIHAHRYRQASAGAENAARASLRCGDRWRAANELLFAAELAHQSADTLRAQRLVHEGFALMRALHPAAAHSVIPAGLLAEKLDSARREIHGEWAYW